MGWATGHIARLSAGETVSFRPRGNSMTGRIESGQLVTCEPVTADTTLGVGDIVLCRVGGAQYLHLVRAVQGGRFQIANNKGHVNGWVGRANVYGRCVRGRGMIYDYSFSVWPDEQSPRMAAAPAVFTLLRVMQPRVLMEFTERGFGDFREELARVGLALREVERVPHHEPEPVC